MDAVDYSRELPPPDPVVDMPTTKSPMTSSDDFESPFGEQRERTLDLATWHPGEDLARLYEKLEAEVKTALAQESSLFRVIRREVLPKLADRNGAPSGAGVYRAKLAEIERTHRAILFNGGIEAVDGTVVSHDTLATTITQIGVCLVAYHGDSGSWVHRLYRRDLRATIADPLAQAQALIERRQRRPGIDLPDRASQLSELAQRGIMAYAERAVLVECATSPWRMGHGNPAPYELLTGSGDMTLLRVSLAMLRRLIGEHRRFVFVPSAPRDRGLLTIGHALMPLEYAVIDTMTDRLRYIVEGGHYGKEEKKNALAFVEEIGPQMLIGIYRTSQAGPPQLFYAHREHVHEAALIAMADSFLQEHRAFPTLIDLADTLCRTTFGPSDFTDSVRLAYADAGYPYRFLGERETRR
jgi:hypothetical protein